MLILALCVSLATDTIRIRPVSQDPAIQNAADLEALGPPSFSLSSTVSVWLLGDSGSVYFIARVLDSTPAFNDRLVLSLDTNGDRAAAPQHDDFLWDFHRVADSSVIYRGRDGRWQPPRDDPDWRLGRDREGGGWTVREKEVLGGWLLIVKLDAEYFSQARSGAPGLGLAQYDDALRQWNAWPLVPEPRRSATLPDHPALWGLVVR